ncbi:MAG: ATP-binding cassette domain-containing protein [Firmicutes bacterium]|nr:ATP-binding cassette domain-containing protein [Bacillota bacterium]
MLELKDFCFTVEQDGQSKKILQNIDLKIPQGRFVVITGPNGGGKTTLAKSIMGIVQPTGGTIHYRGQDITELGITERAKLGISFAFQQPVRFKGLTVADLISLAAGKKLSTVQVCEYLSEVGLCARDYVDREVDAKLSGGELKRIEIAGILARGTELAIFDEPEAGIDLWSFNNLIEVFDGMRRRTDATIIVISHQERILAIADEIVVISGGQVVQQGPGAEVLPALLHADYKYTVCKGGMRND